MFYEHKVRVLMHIYTLKDEVSPADVKETFNNGHWDYEVDDTAPLTPVEVVAKAIDDIKRSGIKKYRHALGDRPDLVLEVLEDLKSRMEDYQSLYEEAL